MSYPLSELILKNVLEKGLTSISTDLDSWIEEIYGQYRNPLAGEGADQILQEIKAYFSGETGDKIDVVSGYPTTLQSSNIVYITLNSTQEDSRQGLGDRWEDINVAQPRRIIINKFDACDYNLETNTLTIRKSAADFALAYPGFLIRDRKGSLFPIKFPILSTNHDDFGESWLVTLDNWQMLDSIQNLEVVSWVDYKIQHRNAIWYLENLSIIINAPSYQKALWLYMATAYVLQSVKPLLEQAGLELSMFNAQDLGRSGDKEPDFVAARRIDIKVRTQATFIKGSSLVPDSLNLYIIPGRVNSEEILTKPTKEAVVEALNLGLPGQTIVGQSSGNSSSFN